MSHQKASEMKVYVNGLIAVTRISLQYTALRNWQFKLFTEINEQFMI